MNKMRSFTDDQLEAELRQAILSISHCVGGSRKGRAGALVGYALGELDIWQTARHTPSVVPQKLNRSDPSAKNEQSDEYEKFASALKTVLSIPHSKIKSKLNAEKRKRTRKSSASPEVASKD